MTTPFQEHVYDACRMLPRGKVTTYGRLATFIGCGSARAVGQALRHNPYAPEVPCHRVVKSDLHLGGFYGHTSGPEVTRKRNLLISEGVQITEQDQVDPACLWSFEADEP